MVTVADQFQAVVHAEGLILPELDFGWNETVAAPMLRARDVVIVAINRADLSHALIENIAGGQRARLV